MAEQFDLAEGVIKLVGDPKAWKLALDGMEKDVVAHEQKVTSLTWKAAQLRAEGIRKIAERANAAVRKFMDTGKYGAPAAALLARERDLKVTQEITYQQNAAKHGRPVADYLEAKRDQKEEKRNQKLVDAFKYGRVGGAIVGGARSFNEKVGAATPAAAAGVAMGAGIAGLVAAASPLAINTLTESLSLLSATIGRDFTPIIVELAMTVQSAVKWWTALDKGIKDNIVQTAKFVAIAGAAVLAVGAITKVVGILAGLGMGPLGWAFLGGTAAAGLMGKGAPGIKEQIAEQDQIMANLEAQRKALNFDPKGKPDLKDMLMPVDKRERDAELGRRLDVVRGRRDALKKQEGDSGMLGSFGPSSFSSLQDFYRKMLLDTTGGSEIQAEQLKVQAETRDAVVELVKVTKEKKGIVP
jgi:hypothetical protein